MILNPLGIHFVHFCKFIVGEVEHTAFFNYDFIYKSEAKNGHIVQYNIWYLKL